MKTREAWSDKAVHIRGAEGKIDALGLEGNVDDGILIFKGPVTLKLNQPDEILEGKTQL
jgi:lipopolysaccharide export system protein LptC